ncbi:MAG: biotin/lipoyl-containing protein, partial [Granulosicoccus sp.]
MTSEIKVPTLPESIADALIVTWHKKEGDPVSRDEVLVDIETDKVVMEVPAAEDGVLGKIIEPEGTTVSAHQVIGSIEASDGAAPAPAAAASMAAAETAAEPENSSAGQTSPSVRKLLDKHGLSASDVKGSGKNGRISKEDVEQHVAGSSKASAPVASIASAPAAASAAPVSTAPASTAPLPIVADGERVEKRVPMTRLR